MVNNVLCGWRNKSFGLLLLRLALGVIFLVHGIQKFQSLDGTAAFFSKLGIPAFFAYVVATVETLSGAAMILGVFTGIAGILLAIIMIVAMLAGSWERGFGGHEFELILLASSLCIFFSGAGKYAAHDKICKNCKACGPEGTSQM